MLKIIIWSGNFDQEIFAMPLRNHTKRWTNKKTHDCDDVKIDFSPV